MSQWTKMLQNWEQWGAPLRPTPEDVALFQSQINPKEKVLLLGATEELIPLADVASDNDLQAALSQKKVILSDWSNLPFTEEFDVIIGDGALTVFQGRSESFFSQMKKALKKGGRLVLRVFISPENQEDIKTVIDAKDQIGFHAFKWRVAHTLANPYVKVKDIYEAILPVRNHPTLEVYRDSDLIYYFPKLSELPSWDYIEYSSSYELSERCPVITWVMRD